MCCPECGSHAYSWDGCEDCGFHPERNPHPQDEVRVCACGCGASLAGLRADAVYASEACSKRARRAKRADKARTRRPSREGRGTRIYLTAEEIGFLGRLPRQRKRRGDQLAGNVMLKLDRAAERAARKE